MKILYTVIIILLLWTIWGYVSSRVEQAEYSVIESKNGYEIRLYPSHIVAQTVVKGSYQTTLNDGFRIVAGYIFGGNTKKHSAENEAISMTAPVMASMDGDSHTIAFGMPRSYTLETLPNPTDSRVHIITVPEKKMAAVRFSWFRTDARVRSKKQQLLDALKRDNMSVRGEPYYAGYNAPWTPPWMTRNEVLVEVE